MAAEPAGAHVGSADAPWTPTSPTAANSAHTSAESRSFILITTPCYVSPKLRRKLADHASRLSTFALYLRIFATVIPRFVHIVDELIGCARYLPGAAMRSTVILHLLVGDATIICVDEPDGRAPPHRQ